MSLQRTFRTPRQMELFTPHPSIPQWNALPQTARCQAMPLLARLLRKHRSHRIHGVGDREVADE